MKQRLSSFYEETRSARKIVVVDFGFLGDTVHLTPSLRALHQNYPEAELHVVTTPGGAEILKMTPCVKRAWVYRLTNPSPPWYRSLGLLRQLRAERFDLLFNFSGADRTVYLSAALGVRDKLSQTPLRWHFYNPLLSRYWAPIVKERQTMPIYLQRLEMLRAAGLDVEGPRFELNISAELLKEAAQWIHPGAIHLSPNTSTPMKEWPVRRWVGLVKLFAKKYPQAVMLLSTPLDPRQLARAEAIVEEAGCPQLKLLPPGLSIPHLSAIISRCAVQLGSDSGPLHLVWALDIPSLTLYRNYQGLEAWIPKDPKHEAILVDCSCIGKKNPECASQGEARCLGEITEEEVFAKLSAMFERGCQNEKTQR